jgi:hypothetical protein
MKSSTRQRKPEETITDLKFVKDDETFAASNFDFQYTYDNHKYGFHKREVEELLDKVDNVFIVIRNLDLIQVFSKAFSNCNIVTTFIYTDFHVVSKRIPNASNLQQKKSIADTFQDYLRHPHVYDEIIINGGTANDFNRLIDLLVTKYTTPKPKSSIQIKPEENYIITHLSKTIIGRIILPIIISSFTTVLMYKFLLGKLTISNPFLLQTILITSSLIVYFVPQLLFYVLVKSKEKYENNKSWFEYVHLIIAIIVYIIMLYTYTLAKH